MALTMDKIDALYEFECIAVSLFLGDLLVFVEDGTQSDWVVVHQEEKHVVANEMLLKVNEIGVLQIAEDAHLSGNPLIVEFIIEIADFEGILFIVFADDDYLVGNDLVSCLAVLHF